MTLYADANTKFDTVECSLNVRSLIGQSYFLGLDRVNAGLAENYFIVMVSRFVFAKGFELLGGKKRKQHTPVQRGLTNELWCLISRRHQND